MSTTNFWAIIVAVIGGAASYYDLKSDNRVRDVVITSHTAEIETATSKLIIVDAKVTDTRELLQKISGQLDGISREQQRVSRALERHTPN